MNSSTNIVLGVTGSIAAYKSAELVRQMSKKGARVQVMMSSGAQEFISSLTLQTLSGNPVRTEMFSEAQESKIGHIELADKANVVVIAPATADCIAKLAGGHAGDIISAVVLATKAPVVVAPAMNVNMWSNVATQNNVSILRERGMTVLEPGDGFLACGWEGAGRLPELEVLLQAIEYVISDKPLAGSEVVVTAGPTREFFDPIRFISNRSTGRMGYAIAQIARNWGANVSLVSGPSDLPVPIGVELHRVTSAVEMHQRVMELVRRKTDDETKGQYAFMVAAVSDHRPAEFSEKKIKRDKGSSYDIEMVPNPDILKELGDSRAEVERESGRPLKLIGFAAETGDKEELLQWAREKLENKNADLMVGNFAHDSFEKRTNRVWVLDRAGRQEELSTADKLNIAEKIVARALKV